MIAIVASTAYHIPMYRASHPVHELEALRFIERTYGVDVTVLGTARTMRRYVKCTYEALPVATSDEARNGSLYIDRVKNLVGTTHADFVVIGRLTLANRPVGLLDAAAAPDFLESVYENPDVVVYRVVRGKKVGETDKGSLGHDAPRGD
jgi:hypothetical protein